MAQQSNTASEPLQVVGTRTPNLDAIERVTGQAKYTGDLELPGMLVARVLRSPHPNARIVRIDTSQAEALQGVRTVVTYRDVPKLPVWAHRNYVLNEQVRFKGEAVAGIAAVDAETADEALKLIAVEYEVLPFVLDPEEAMQPTAPQLFPDGNLAGQPRVLTRGDVERGLAESDRVIEREYHCPTSWSGGMEPRANVAAWEGDRLTVWASTQSPGRIVNALAALFDLPEHKVRVIATYIGGGFGTKSANHIDEALTALLARRTRRPVKLQYSREEEILDSNTRFESKMYARVGVKQDMTLHALDVRYITNQGAYHIRLGGLGTQSTHVYNVPHLKTEQFRVHTNIPNTGPTRGVGDPQETFGLESLMDEVAHEMGWDPVAFRLKNIKRTGDPVPRGGGREDGRLASHAMDRCIEEGARRIGWERRNSSPGAGQASSRVRGIGVALTERSTGGGQGAAIVKVNRDGSAIVFWSSTDLGQGSRTTMPMIVAEILGIPLTSVRAVSGDTEMAPYEPGSIGNRTTRGTGTAVDQACRDCLQQIFQTAAPMLEAMPDALEARNGAIRVAEQPERSVSFQDVLQRHGRTVVGEGAMVQDQTNLNVERGPAAHFAEVEVDKETGKVRILRYVAAHDVGQPLNLTIVENQIEGGSIQGLALALSEQLHFDARTGWCLSANFLDLKPPTALDVDPRVVEAVVVQNKGEDKPFGAKGMGENPCHPGMAAVANAIFNATGLRLREPPFSRASILEALSRTA